ncbi:MAG: hypothetical protein AUJ72_02390 [Candidatus Omnitrophica bacterium CG1_02_46_14]|nr:MAG: hypothetical protein AUJ72_02390 [Candidatus Omnitrophica bacterium CG1_02_46_14]
MTKLIQSLSSLATLADQSSDASKIISAVQVVKTFVQESKKQNDASKAMLLEQLETELGTWQTKLSVILNEPAGKKGMVKHVRFWIEKLK